MCFGCIPTHIFDGQHLICDLPEGANRPSLRAAGAMDVKWLINIAPVNGRSLDEIWNIWITLW